MRFLDAARAMTWGVANLDLHVETRLGYSGLNVDDYDLATEMKLEVAYAASRASKNARPSLG
jgi:hypothetical protein